MNALAARLRGHWPMYLAEAAALGTFMVSASAFALLLFHPASALGQALGSGWARLVLMGLAMGGTAVALIYSPWGRLSGAHMNPGITLAFLRLGKIAPADAFWYVIFQFAGGISAMALMRALAGSGLMDGSVRYVVTVPAGADAVGAAWAAEFLMSFGLMMTVLVASNRRGTARFTGLIAGGLVATFIVLAAPVSGMSINPARTFASAIVADVWTAWWVYFTAPPLAMLIAAQAYLWLAGAARVYCAKLHHDERSRCIFRCRHHELMSAPSAPPAPAPVPAAPTKEALP